MPLPSACWPAVGLASCARQVPPSLSFSWFGPWNSSPQSHYKSTESTLSDPLQAVIHAARNRDGLLGGVPGRVLRLIPPIAAPQANRSQDSKPMLLQPSRKDPAFAA